MTQPTDDEIRSWFAAEARGGTTRVREIATAALAEYDRRADRDQLREHILDIDAHATPDGDIPDDPGYTGVYLLTAGALHRALGKIGHTAPSCAAEAEARELRAALTELRAASRGLAFFDQIKCARWNAAYDQATQVLGLEDDR